MEVFFLSDTNFNNKNTIKNMNKNPKNLTELYTSPANKIPLPTRPLFFIFPHIVRMIITIATRIKTPIGLLVISEKPINFIIYLC